MTGPLVPTLRAAGLAAALLLSQSARAGAAAPPASYDWWEDAPDVARAPLRGFSRADGAPHILFVNFDGAEITEALWDNASKNETSLTGSGGS